MSFARMLLVLVIFTLFVLIMGPACAFELKKVTKSIHTQTCSRNHVVWNSKMPPIHLFKKSEDSVPVTEKSSNEKKRNETKPSVLEQVASKGLAGVLAIAVAEAIFWAAGMPLATLWVKISTGEWLDLSTAEGQVQAAAFTFGYGGFATVILQYRVTLFAIPLVPIMEKLIVSPARTFLGEKFGSSKKN